MPSPARSLDRRYGPLFAVLAAVVTFVESARYAFVYDDHWTIEHNRWLAKPLGTMLSPILAGRAAESGIPDATRPSMALSTWIDHRLFGLSPAAFHLHSLLLYLLVVVLAWRVLLILTGRPRAALAGSLFFAVAPVHAEVVSAINYREDLLAAVGVLVPLMVLFERRSRAITSSLAVALAAVWLLGLCAKESAIVLVLLILTSMLVLRVDRAWIRARERAFLALGAALLVWGNWRAALLLRGDDIPRAAAKSVFETLSSTAHFEVRALAGSFVPVFWSPEHGAAKPPAMWPAWAAALAVLVGVVVLLARRPATRVVALGIAFVLVSPLATSPLARPANAFADRYLFLSVLGAAMVYGASWDVWQRSRRTRPAVAGAVLVSVVVALSFVGWRASRAWRSDETLWASAAERAPQSPRAWTGLSRVRRLSGDLDGADVAVARAVALDDTYLPARVTVAYNLLARGEVAAAKLELDGIVARGGASLGGVARARKCAELPPDRARRCVVVAP